MCDAYSVNGVVLAATCKHPERTMMALDLLVEDPAYARLLYYGIDGVNYVETADGKLGLPEGVTNETNTYTGENAGF